MGEENDYHYDEETGRHYKTGSFGLYYTDSKTGEDVQVGGGYSRNATEAANQHRARENDRKKGFWDR